MPLRLCLLAGLSLGGCRSPALQSEPPEVEVEVESEVESEPQPDRPPWLFGGQTVPAVATPLPPVGDGVFVQATKNAVVVHGQKVAAIADGVVSNRKGHLVGPLYDALEYPLGGTPMLIVADAELSVANLLDLLYTGARAGFREYALVVHSAETGYGSLRLTLPVFDDGERMVLGVHISPTGLRIDDGTGPAREGPPDLVALGARASTFAAAHGDRARATVTADEATTLQALAETIATLRGDGGIAAVALQAGGPAPGGRFHFVKRSDETPVKGAMDKDIIRRVVRRNIEEVRHCYNQGLVEQPDLSGRVTVQFTIGPEGTVIASLLSSSTLNHRGVEQCIVELPRRWQFPRPTSGGNAVVSYPFVLKPG